MKKLFIQTLAVLGVALFIIGSMGAKGKFHYRQKSVMAILDTVPDSPKKMQLVYVLDSVPDSPKKKLEFAYIKYDTVPDSPKKKMEYAYIKYDTVPDSPKKFNFVALR